MNLLQHPEVFWFISIHGMVIAAIVASIRNEILEHKSRMVESQTSAGIWAGGFLILTTGLKIALPILRQSHPEEHHS